MDTACEAQPASPQRPDWQTLQVTVSPALFEKFQRLIYADTGIWLGPSKVALLCGRLSRRLRALDIRTLAQYYQLVTDPDQQSEKALMIDAITTNETQFFREPKHFEFLAEKVFPRWRAAAAERQRGKTIRVWSAGCSSGEEPYSLAMWLASHLPASEGWDLRIFATDISSQVLTKARNAVYSVSRSGDIPDLLLKRFMMRGINKQEGSMKIGREIRDLVEFERLNLSQDPYPTRPFDFIFCRNVLIYFDQQSKRRVVDSLTQCLPKDGLLFIGHAENINGLTSRLRPLAPTIYCKAESHCNLVHDFNAGVARRPSGK
jgi:chemotaxis protein methyltransferase CheR